MVNYIFIGIENEVEYNISYNDTQRIIKQKKLKKNKRKPLHKKRREL